MEIYQFDGYSMTEDQMEIAEAALEAVCAAGADNYLVKDLWDQGIMVSNVDAGEIVFPSSVEGEMIGVIMRDTCDIPYHIIRRSRATDDEYWILCVPGDNEGLSNFGAEMGGLDGTIEAIENGTEVCAGWTCGDELPRLMRTTLIQLDPNWIVYVK